MSSTSFKLEGLLDNAQSFSREDALGFGDVHHLAKMALW